MSDDLTRMTAAELSGELRAKNVSATEVTQAHLDRIADVDDARARVPARGDRAGAGRGPGRGRRAGRPGRSSARWPASRWR